eukprot:750241-Hanusia_phi.AAC.5
MVRHFGELMRPGGSCLALSFIASERVIPGYGGGMSSAKAQLESDTRVLAYEAGRRFGIRVNAISAGPLLSRAASAIENVSGRALEAGAAKLNLRRRTARASSMLTSIFMRNTPRCSEGWTPMTLAELPLHSVRIFRLLSLACACMWTTGCIAWDLLTVGQTCKQPPAKLKVVQEKGEAVPLTTHCLCDGVLDGSGDGKRCFSDGDLQQKGNRDTAYRCFCRMLSTKADLNFIDPSASPPVLELTLFASSRDRALESRLTLRTL